MVTVLCETSHAAARCRQFARLGDPVSRPLISLWQKPSLHVPVLVLHTWHDCKLKGVHGRAWKRWLAALPHPEGQQDLPSQVFHHFAPGPFLRRSTYISHYEALRGHPRREHFVVIRGGVLKYAGQRRIRT